MWSDPDVTYVGRHFQLAGAQCDPKPLQKPHPPIWIGGGGEQLTLRVVARHADRSNFGGKPHEFAHKCEVLKEHCKAVGRDYDEIMKTISGEVFMRETDDEIVEAGTRSMWASRSTRGGRATSSARPSRCARRSRRTSISVAPGSCVVLRLPRRPEPALVRRKGHPELPLTGYNVGHGNLSVDTAVERVDEHRYRASLDRDWEIWGPMGGYIASYALRAIAAETRVPRPASFSCHYLSVAAFDDIEIVVTPLRTSRVAGSYRAEILQGDRRILEATAWAIADGVAALEHDEAVAPDVAGPTV